MKQKYIILVILLLLGVFGYGQQFKGGFVGGITATQVSGDRLSGPDKGGVCFGPFINLEINKRSSLQMELTFVQKGSRRNPDSLSNYSYLLRLNYMEIPVHYIYRHSEKFSFETGLSYAVRVSSYEAINGYENEAGDYPFENRDVSFNIGLYYHINDRMKVNVRYSNSVLHIRKHKSGTSSTFNKGQYNEVILLSLQYEIKQLFGVN
ncbi:MAG: outer membrane beta-barrel protein [Bacteroidota bacterium]|nr:outer membrane beta-barrel protein [Bacteroidota bacterium]